jgi:hypothetical protein
MKKRMLLMLAGAVFFLGAIGFVKYKQIQTAMAQGMSPGSRHLDRRAAGNLAVHPGRDRQRRGGARSAGQFRPGRHR